MKNTIYLTSAFAFELLENIEDDLNYINIHLKTTMESNQQIEVVIRGVTHFFPLQSGVESEVSIPSTLWALGSTTGVRLVNDSFVSDWIYLTFPDTLQTDALLEQTDNTHFYMQGQSSEEQELKMQIITYQNGSAFIITDLTQIVHIAFATVIENTQALFNATINLLAQNVTDTALVTVRMRVNNEFDEVFIPRQNLKDGYHVLTISYPVTNILQDSSNSIDLLISCSGGEIAIDQGGALASLIGTGLAGAHEFDGKIDVLDAVADFNVYEIPTEAVNDNVSFDFLTPYLVGLTDNVAMFNIAPFEVENVNDNCVVVWDCTPMLRVLEDQETERITEDGDYRYTEKED